MELAARRAARWLVGESLISVEALLTRGEDEGLTTVTTDEGLILEPEAHLFRYSLVGLIAPIAGANNKRTLFTLAVGGISLR